MKGRLPFPFLSTRLSVYAFHFDLVFCFVRGSSAILAITNRTSSLGGRSFEESVAILFLAILAANELFRNAFGSLAESWNSKNLLRHYLTMPLP